MVSGEFNRKKKVILTVVDPANQDEERMARARAKRLGNVYVPLPSKRG